ncbi:hypothetical protein HanPI659440_Chr04g0171121 [Helianthus annuus]|nr:hypothetical protein HanHA300_Chr04g0144881 [Helianthus annuus]KAJ0762051.1 hypothetical protein HanOQP8_Chr04g0157101 [Helianthus annuus]KAJ0797199.1 hypothetical protein HanPI659440_Chr04g0171121 [Helianthus annuus]
MHSFLLFLLRILNATSNWYFCVNWYCMYLYIDMKVENFILVLEQSELMSDHELDDSDTEFIDIDISGSYSWIMISDGDIGFFSD